MRERKWIMTTDKQIQAMTIDKLADFLINESLTVDDSKDMSEGEFKQAVIVEYGKKRKTQTWALVSKTYTRGFMPETAKVQRYDLSDAKIEAENTAGWTKARQCTPIKGTLWIYGAQGVGKTFMAHCIATEYLQR